ncbi:hypothetical protein MMC11_002368 [Xylographa trunciseda]|nr:hypothetical protein [Xylographa trunciseda]
MPIANGLSLSICYSRTKKSESMEVGVYAAFNTSTVSNIRYQYYSLPYSTSKVVSVRRTISSKVNDSTLVELGFYCKGEIEGAAQLQILSAFRLVITPVVVPNARPAEFTIDEIRLVKRGSPPHEQKRLTWRWHGKEEQWHESFPWSKTTGPFSHFTIYAEGCELGRSYCLEFPLIDEELKEFMQDAGTDKISFKIRGTGFGGLCFPIASESCVYEEKMS